jgi:hypothetical protein
MDLNEPDGSPFTLSIQTCSLAARGFNGNYTEAVRAFFGCRVGGGGSLFHLVDGFDDEEDDEGDDDESQ